MEDNKDNIQQQPSEGKNKGIETPQPPQRQDPRDQPTSDHESKIKGGPNEEIAGDEKSVQQPHAGKQPAADRSSERQGPPAPGESEKDLPTTTTNRNSY